MNPLDSLRNKSLLRDAALLGGEWVGADSGAEFAVDNPASGMEIARVPKMGAAETRRAIAAAAAAFPEWRGKTAKERGAVLARWHRLAMENAEDLARIMTAEQGKPTAESRGEVAYGASFLQWFAEEAKRDGGEVVPAFKPNSRVLITREPAGVAALITPWNFPIAMITRKAAPALAAGCPVVAKPASATPLSALAMAALAEEAGVPPGVMSVLTGGAKDIGDEMCRNPEVRVLSFTGSTEIGKGLAARCAATLKKVALELGGNAPFIVFDDADLPLAAKQALVCKFRNSGQTCVCANRFYAQESVHDEFVRLLKAEVEGLKVADGFAEGASQGPLINSEAVEKAEAHVADAVKRGAKVVVGGGRHSLGGNFFQPTILTGMTDDSLPVCEETFGPVAPVFKFKTEEEAVRRANATPHGLASYFCARDLGRVMRVSEALEAGMVGVNEGIISSEAIPFGGVKESGIGREGGAYGMEEYTEVKYTLVGFPPAPVGG